MTSQSLGLQSPSHSNALPTPSPSSFDLESIACRSLQANMLSDLLWEIYFTTFETRYVTWLGNSCRPYLGTTAPVSGSTSTYSIILNTDRAVPQKPKASITRMILRLDLSEETSESKTSQYLPQVPGTLLQRKPHWRENSTLLINALRYAIYAYAIRWLPLRSANVKVHGYEQSESQNREEEVRVHMWYQAKQAILPALTRPSYRSILALILFTLTEMPATDPDPGFSQLCNQALFGHVNALRSLMTWDIGSYFSEEQSTSPIRQVHQGSPIIRGRRMVLEENCNQERSNVFWLCVVSPCSRALVQQHSSLILPGNAGNEEVWGFIRQRTEIFTYSFGTLKGSQDPFPAGVVEVILQHATACKTMYMGVINQLCDSLFYHKLLPVEETAQGVLDEATRFRNVFDHLLSICARDYIYLSEVCRLNYGEFDRLPW